jgi:hypothetical protein
MKLKAVGQSPITAGQMMPSHGLASKEDPDSTFLPLVFQPARSRFSCHTINGVPAKESKREFNLSTPERGVILRLSACC